MPIDIIIFAAIAAFIVLRLRNVLGRRTGNERPPASLGGERNRRENSADKVVNFPEKAAQQPQMDLTHERAEPGSPVERGLTAIKKADKSFNADDFLNGACGAFEMIIQAFADGNMGSVKAFIADDVYRNFVSAVEAREKAGETLETTIIGINASDILEAKLEGRNALVTIKFLSEQINVTRDTDGRVIEGDPDRVTEVTDIWTFMRDVRSRDPNWILVETRSPN